MKYDYIVEPYTKPQLKLKIKRLSKNAVIPSYANPGDAGLDLTATSKKLTSLKCGAKILTYGTDLAIELPEGYVGLLFPRSSASKTSLSLCNAVGVLDSSYRGEVMLKFRIDANSRPMKGGTYMVGDRIAQLVIMPYPQIKITEVDELSDTERGQGGFGSSGE